MRKTSNNKNDLLNLNNIKNQVKKDAKNLIFNEVNNLSQFLEEKRKRFYSLPLKAFKVSSPQKSKILSTICDNIFEDEVINDNINLSMIKLKTKINIKSTFNCLDNDKNIEKSKDLPEEGKNRNIKKIQVEDKDDFPIGPRPHKKSFIFNNIIKIRNIKCPRLLEDQWKYEKILLDYNIIDFTSKKINNINLF